MEKALAYLRRVPPGPVIAVAAVLWLWSVAGSPDAAARVPALERLQVAQAHSIATAEGFRVQIVETNSGGVPGTVVAQDPLPDTIEPKGTQITLQVTKGARQARVPNVAGMPVDEARDAIVRSKLQPGDVVYEEAPGKESNRVLRTEPAAGALVDAGSKVDIVSAP